MIETYDDLMELMDKIQIAHRYNEKKLTFRESELSVKEAEALVEQHTKGGRRGSE